MIAFSPTLALISSNNGEDKHCNFSIYLSDKKYNDFSIIFNPNIIEESITLIINGTHFLCKTPTIYLLKLYTNYIGFKGASNTNICNVELS